MSVVKNLLPICLAMAGVLATDMARAGQPFSDCPSEAFLVQDSVPKLYGVDLSTGYVDLLGPNLGTSGKFNGIGFSYADAYIYGWSYEHRTLARVGSDLALEPITLAQPLDDNYFVGDITPDGAYYYVYKRGADGSHGLWRIGLFPDNADYLQPVKIVSGSELQLAIFDFAFHPSNGMLYSVTRGGDLISINPTDGSMAFLADLGETGTYGAVYFDVDANLYISRNTDGAIFQVKPDASEITAVRFAQGPKSGQNDGARCALAPVIAPNAATADFGDAPDSYGTRLASNGARHNTVDSQVWLGQTVDAEAQAWPAPLSDDQTNTDDEDGVVFITPLAAGEQALVSVTVHGGGYLNAWVDLDLDGTFGDSEQVVDARYLEAGQHVLTVQIPADAGDGSTWSRFRISSTSSLGPQGGIADGEVEDHPVQLFGRIVTSSYYPGPQGYVSLAYEDLWPVAGDYDLNDLVVYYRTVVNTVNLSNAPQDAVVDSVTIQGEISAIGATLQSGFAVELTGIPRSAVDEDRLSLTLGGKATSRLILEEGAGYEHAVLIIYENAWNHVDADDGCNFYRTQNSCSGTGGGSRFTLNVPLKADVQASLIDDQLFNPFIFGSTARRLEIHLKNRAPTPRADTSAFGTGDDASQPGAGLFYQTNSGLPWAIVIGDAWVHPQEAHDLLQTYPGFEQFVQSRGASNLDWFRSVNAVSSKLYQE